MDRPFGTNIFLCKCVLIPNESDDFNWSASIWIEKTDENDNYFGFKFVFDFGLLIQFWWLSIKHFINCYGNNNLWFVFVQWSNEWIIDESRLNGIGYNVSMILDWTKFEEKINNFKSNQKKKESTIKMKSKNIKADKQGTQKHKYPQMNRWE